MRRNFHRNFECDYARGLMTRCRNSLCVPAVTGWQQVTDGALWVSRAGGVSEVGLLMTSAAAAQLPGQGAGDRHIDNNGHLTTLSSAESWLQRCGPATREQRCGHVGRDGTGKPKNVLRIKQNATYGAG